MEEQTQERLSQLQDILALNEVPKITKKLTKLGFSCSELLQQLIETNHNQGIQILQSYSNNFTELKGKSFVALILYLSTQEPNIEAILQADKLLQSTQYVGTFVKNYEKAIQDHSPFSQQIVNHIVQNKTNVPNFNLIFDKLFQICKQKQLDNIHEFEQLMNTQKDVVLIIDKPIIKIFPLTPRIKSEYLPKHLQIKKTQNAISKQEELRSMQRKKIMTKKKLMRELYKEQNQLHKIKKDKLLHQLDKQKDGYKKGLRLLEEQQMELKKLKTMQLNIKRHKKKSSRKGGNKH
ncbi:unnamed protein product (macronuclear) [Paramecium tetraurelia]|uniref:UBA domain-containing protein n=1 Tax=Paramecium tetraurelia TaxID=5888 RepID=A0EEN3_PARTE|nr:uncharacterized protein GSPATT00026096001 [Paramecium tetraurelia]CAK93774.1 unnamed protein product [Paramecium tetraurelia]|eukprot:XP_001461147.1 hypothetical protein (macronuclear) [Paramecium tetraurelia strain d4-2]